MVNKFYRKLSQNLLELLEGDEEYYDVTIEVGNDPYAKIFRAHMAILNYRSPYLRRVLSTNKKKNGEALLHIKLPNILPETFQVILRYIYGGEHSLEGYDTSEIIKILVSANEFGLQELIPYVESFLIKHEDWIEQDFNLIYKTTFENNSFLKLKNYCTRLISKNPDKIFKSPNFSSIPKNLLVSIIQSSNLQMSEVQIWEHVIKWGIAQNPELSSNPRKYSKDDFNILKNTLQQCIPLIKFYDLTAKEFLDKVTPYKKIFPKELYNNLLGDFLNNDNKPVKSSKEIHSIDIDSKIITSQHSELILKWIYGLEVTDKLTSSHELKLLFRCSRDGIEKFHKIYDNKSHTIAIVKVENSSEILGGYNPIEWKSDDTWGDTKDSFIFSFNNNDSVENHILSRVKNRERAVYNKFKSFGGIDLILLKGPPVRVQCKENAYEKPIRETDDYSVVEELEVFRII